MIILHFLLLTGRVLSHCPATGVTTVLHEHANQRFRGAFAAPGGGGRRLWLLASPKLGGARGGDPRTGGGGAAATDELRELDTLTGRIMRVLTIPGTADAHDSVRVARQAFPGRGFVYRHVAYVFVPAEMPWV